MSQTSLTFAPTNPHARLSEADQFEINRFAITGDDIDSGSDKIEFSSDGKTVTIIFNASLTPEQLAIVRQNVERKLALKLLKRS